MIHSKMRHTHKLFMILCLSATAQSVPASAQEVPPAVQAMLDNMERQTQVKPTYDSIETAGDGSITISNLTFEKPAVGGQPAMLMRIEETELSEISDEGGGLYEIGGATFANLTGQLTGDGFAMTLAMPEGEAEGWYVKTMAADPTPGEILRASMNIARKMSSGKVTVTIMGQTISADGYETTWDGDPETGAGAFTMRLNNVAIPETAIAMVDQPGMLKQLGYSGINIDLTSEGRIDIADDNLGLKFDFGITGRDMAAVRLAFAAAGMPVAVYAEMQKAQLAGTQPDINTLLPQMQDISVSGLSLRFEDQSITKKLLPMLAAMQGMDEAGLIAGVGPMLQMGLMQLQNQAFAEQAAAAVSGFLKDPKSLTITAKPETPVKVSEFTAMNPAAPGDIITRLGVSVTSND